MRMKIGRAALTIYLTRKWYLNSGSFKWVVWEPMSYRDWGVIASEVILIDHAPNFKVCWLVQALIIHEYRNGERKTIAPYQNYSALKVRNKSQITVGGV